MYCYADTICALNASIAKNLAAQKQLAAKSVTTKVQSSFVSWLADDAYAEPAPRRKNPNDQKEQIQKQWKDFLGIDIFYPVLKAQEIVETRTKTQILDFHGKAELTKGRTRYVFKRKF
jgi:hypothetical protein